MITEAEKNLHSTLYAPDFNKEKPFSTHKPSACNSYTHLQAHEQRLSMFAVDRHAKEKEVQMTSPGSPLK